MISRYMVLVASEQKLLMMRPYQIYAVKDIVECIEQNCGNGYIWHTTGSGKTLTSFKASTLLKANPNIEKCLFVVDRKDLDRQTREEFNRFQEGCVEENTNTGTLVRRLLSDDYADKVIVMHHPEARPRPRRKQQAQQEPGEEGPGDLQGTARTAARQAHGLHLRRVPPLAVRRQPPGHQGVLPQRPALRLHRHAHLRAERQRTSSIEGDVQTLKTTQDLFQKELHAYTITHAIEDRNVLRFHVDYYKPEGKNVPKPGETLAKRAVVEAILAKHDAATGGRRFNAILATASINDAIEYYGIVQEAAGRETDRPTQTSSR